MALFLDGVTKARSDLTFLRSGFWKHNTQPGWIGSEFWISTFCLGAVFVSVTCETLEHAEGLAYGKQRAGRGNEACVNSHCSSVLVTGLHQRKQHKD